MINSCKKGDTCSKKAKKWFFYLCLGGFFVHFFHKSNKKKRVKKMEKNFHEFLHRERKIIDKYLHGKESLGEFCHESKLLFVDYFIPSERNDHRPKILATKNLAILALFAFLLKIFAISYLLFVIPNLAKMEGNMTDDLLVIINQERAKNNLPEYKLNPELSKAAMAKADDMILQGYFAHVGPDDKKPWDWIDREEYAYLYVAENLAMDFSSPESAHRALMNSESHKKNILSTKYNDIGLSIIKGEFEGKNTNILVQLFAQEKEVVAPVALEAQNKEPKIVSTQEIKSIDEINQIVQTQEQKVVTEYIAKKEEIEKKINPEKQETFQNVLEKVDTNVPKASLGLAKATKDNFDNVNSNIDLNMAGYTDARQEIFVKNNNLSIVSYIFIGLQVFYAMALVVIAIFFMISIIIKHKIQHKMLIAEVLVLMLFLSGLFAINGQILGGIAHRIFII